MDHIVDEYLFTRSMSHIQLIELLTAIKTDCNFRHSYTT